MLTCCKTHWEGAVNEPNVMTHKMACWISYRRSSRSFPMEIPRPCQAAPPELIKIQWDEQTSVKGAKHLAVYLCLSIADRIPSICVPPFDPDLALLLVFQHLLADKGPFQRKCMAVHVNEHVLFTVKVAQTCALLSQTPLLQPNRLKFSDVPVAGFLP